MMKIDKIPAFTLVEITIVLLLSMMVIGIVSLGYRHFEQYRSLQRQSSVKLSEVLLMHNRFLNYFERAKIIEENTEEKQLIFKDSVAFASCRFEEGGIVFLQAGNKDTLRMKIHNLIIRSVNNLHLIDRLSFELGENEKLLSFDYKKDYARALLFNTKDLSDEY
ncbi:MAG: hypothetical protein COC06_09540 [Bacteroidales bacterium]|nr:MAG: hypothetical protein COC06_09540 [Bacteroidales bacterium]